MSLPALWVDRLFAKLAVRYGVAFTRQYEGLDIAAVKEDWADVLAGFDGESIAYALRYLPAEKPPTAMQFRDLCRRAPRREDPALPAPKTEPSPEVMAKVKDVGKPRAEAFDPKGWAKRLKAREEAGDRLTKAQREMWRTALAVETVGAEA